jgi:hypothetical protein
MRINTDTIEAADAYLKVLDVDTFTDLIWQIMQSEDIELSQRPIVFAHDAALDLADRFEQINGDLSEQEQLDTTAAKTIEQLEQWIGGDPTHQALYQLIGRAVVQFFITRKPEELAGYHKQAADQLPPVIRLRLFPHDLPNPEEFQR